MKVLKNNDYEDNKLLFVKILNRIYLAENDGIVVNQERYKNYNPSIFYALKSCQFIEIAKINETQIKIRFCFQQKDR